MTAGRQDCASTAEHHPLENKSNPNPVKSESQKTAKTRKPLKALQSKSFRPISASRHYPHRRLQHPKRHPQVATNLPHLHVSIVSHILEHSGPIANLHPWKEQRRAAEVRGAT